jgi:hypothetical protein
MAKVQLPGQKALRFSEARPASVQPTSISSYETAKNMTDILMNIPQFWIRKLSVLGAKIYSLPAFPFWDACAPET